MGHGLGTDDEPHRASDRGEATRGVTAGTSGVVISVTLFRSFGSRLLGTAKCTPTVCRPVQKRVRRD